MGLLAFRDSHRGGAFALLHSKKVWARTEACVIDRIRAKLRQIDFMRTVLFQDPATGSWALSSQLFPQGLAYRRISRYLLIS